MKINILYLGFLLALPILFCRAEEENVLQQLLERQDNYQTSFIQNVYHQDGKLHEKSKGRFLFKRGDGFIWEYTDPYHQKIVFDGVNIWSYDVGLEQVTINTFDYKKNSTLLSFFWDVVELDERFFITTVAAAEQSQSLGDKGYLMVPNYDDDNFTKMILYTRNDRISAVVLFNLLRQKTVIEFVNAESPIHLSKKTFNLQIPSTVDVVDLRSIQ